MIPDADDGSIEQVERVFNVDESAISGDFKNHLQAKYSREYDIAVLHNHR